MIIGLSGFAQTGKDTIANHLVENYGYRRVAFADLLREALYRLDPNITDIPELPGVTVSSAVRGLGWELLKQSSPQVRGLLQRMGTEVGREMFGKDFWVKQAFKNVYKGSNIVFTDVRFPNEYDAVRQYDGALWRVEKSDVYPVNAHSSETALDGFDFDKTIYNNGTKETLYAMVDFLMQEM